LKPIIEVKHVWKEYQKGIDRRYKSLRDTITRIPGSIFGEAKEKFWALEDIDFKVEAGESIGIIGKNGAGKSTLLKILSRITPPTKGEIVLRGRVASLLEVGTGFHPELTGRENIFFNGSILGMKNQEIKRKFDEIVDFSGVESFIDTPLKHYSSGMQMRLAFSVAAHLESEILLIDEVLAVGDAEFQKKCIGKMDDVSKGEGKTILFVSHDLILIKNLCQFGILIKDAKIKPKKEVNLTITEYLKNLKTHIFDISNSSRRGLNRIKFTKIEFLGENKKSTQFNLVKSGESLNIRFYYSSIIRSSNIKFSIGINSQIGQRICILNSDMLKSNLNIHTGQGFFELSIKRLPLTIGSYTANVYCEVDSILEDWIKDAFCFEVIGGDFYKIGKEYPKHNGNVYFEFNII